MWRYPSRFTSVFDDVEREFVEADEMLNRLFRTIRSGFPTDAVNMPYYYGYQITIGADGKPHVREFGNLKPAAKGLIGQSSIREPLVNTAMDKKNSQLIITAELPGVSKEDVKVSVAEQYISIHAEKGDKKYHSDIPVDISLDKDSAKASYINGILELKIKVKEEVKPNAKEIKIE